MLKDKRNIILLSVFLVGFVLLDLSKPTPVDWTPYFENTKKSPYSCYILYDLFEDLFPGQRVTSIPVSFYQFFNDLPEKKSNLIMINPYFNMDDLDLSKLLEVADEGNSVFISTTQFPPGLMDTLHFTVAMAKILDSTFFHPEQARLNFENRQIKHDTGYVFQKQMYTSYFSSFDKANTTVLGTYHEHYFNFLKIPYGQGHFFLHTQPLCFTNYHLLNSNYQYASYALSYLPIQPVIWDEYYKPFKEQSASPLRVILTDEALKMAYIALVVSLLLYLFFMSKRKQRIIPVIRPPENTSLEFLTTISNLHLYQANYRDIALKKFRYFLDYIESQYHLKPGKTDEEFISKLVLKSGIEKKKIEKMMEVYSIIHSQRAINKEMLSRFCGRIEEFYESAL